jgi:hypothetical protein
MNRPAHWAASFTLFAALAAGTALIAMGAAAQTDNDDTPTVATAPATAPQPESRR